MFYDFSNYQSIEDIEDLNILHTQLLSTIKKHVIEPYVGIYLIGSFCFNINNSNDIDIMYCTPKKYKRIHLKAFEYNKLLKGLNLEHVNESSSDINPNLNNINKVGSIPNNVPKGINNYNVPELNNPLLNMQILELDFGNGSPKPTIDSFLKDGEAENNLSFNYYLSQKGLRYEPTSLDFKPDNTY